MNVTQLLERARERLRRVTPAQAAAAAEHGALLVDIRPEGLRLADGLVPGALVIDRNVLEWRLDPTSPWHIPEIRDHHQTVILVCAEGYASSLAAATLQDLGLTNATDVIGGQRAWPLEASTAVPAE